MRFVRITLYMVCLSYTLSREYQVVRNRYSRLLFTSEDRICANLRVQRTIDEHVVKMPVARVCVTSQINYGDVTLISQKKLSLATMAKSTIDNGF